MADTVTETKSTAPAAPAPAAKPNTNSTPKKTDKVKIKLIGAGSIDVKGIRLKKGESVSVDAVKAEELLKTGFFSKL